MRAKPPRPQPSEKVLDYDDGDPYSCMAAGREEERLQQKLLQQVFECFGHSESVLDGLAQRDLAGVQKGLHTILKERGLVDERGCLVNAPPGQEDRVLLKNEMCRLLEEQSDFKAQLAWLAQIIAERGHHILFYPKYHCELNWIERYWGYCKRYTRERADGTMPTLEANVNAAAKSVPPDLFLK